MTKVIVGDSCALIQLAVISMTFFTPTNPHFEIVVHPKALQEIKGVSNNLDKSSPLKPYLEKFIAAIQALKAVTQLKTPDQKMLARMDARIRSQESAMRARRSAPASENDRFFLIIAEYNEACFCTREGTLHSLAKIVLQDKAWGVSKVIEFAVNFNVLKKGDVQIGLDRLPTVNETLHPDCITYLKDLGYKVA